MTFKLSTPRIRIKDMLALMFLVTVSKTAKQATDRMT
jgi:hypothetical protein